MKNNWVLVTGSVRRGGEAIARALHARGHRLVLHCRTETPAAIELVDEFNRAEAASACLWEADLAALETAPPHSSEISGLVLNASQFEPSTVAALNERLATDWKVHLQGHMQIVQWCASSLKVNHGSIVAVTDVHVDRPGKHHPAYLMAKGALATAVRVLAVEMAPHVRVNGVAPGALAWPERDLISEDRKRRIIESVPLSRTGTFEELARAVEFLMLDATYCTGVILPVDGGRSIYLE